MKTAKSSKREAANRPIRAAARRDPTTQDIEMLTAVMECLVEKVREDRATPMRTAVNQLCAEAKAAAEKLGFDTTRGDWEKLLEKESDSYPHTQADGDEELWQQIPKPGRARIRALELINHFAYLAKDLEFHVQEYENWLAELRAVLAADPAPMPLPTLIQQVHEYDGRDQKWTKHQIQSA
jgi:hypothetical protein